MRGRAEVDAAGRLTLPVKIRKEIGIDGLHAYCGVEVFGAKKDKLLLTIIGKWKPSKGPGKDVVKCS